MKLKTRIFLSLLININLIAYTALFGQQTITIPTDPIALKKFKAWVLNHTDHGYFGVEGGITFNFGPTNVRNGNHDYIEPINNSLALGNIGFVNHPRFFAGYAWKKHYFEGVLGSMSDRTRFLLKDSLMNDLYKFSTENTYSTISFRYLYNYTPFKSNVIKFLIGAELGYALRSIIVNTPGGGSGGGGGGIFNPQPYSVVSFVNNVGYFVDIQNNQMHVHQFFVGVNSRIDFKIKKNLTMFLNGTFLSIIQNGEMYKTTLRFPGGTEYVAIPAGSGLNMFLHYGIKFDFFTSKKKRETYDKLGIEDPFRDK